MVNTCAVSASLQLLRRSLLCTDSPCCQEDGHTWCQDKAFCPRAHAAAALLCTAAQPALLHQLLCTLWCRPGRGLKWNPPFSPEQGKILIHVSCMEAGPFALLQSCARVAALLPTSISHGLSTAQPGSCWPHCSGTCCPVMSGWRSGQASLEPYGWKTGQDVFGVLTFSVPEEAAVQHLQIPGLS